ncbi:MAG TPA: hypothetical protein VF522_10410 [Ramlibacter sp.]|uniref:hypothetical protein n=1 Tax=Ramlibacter sp. TaxID=1917967 RepID=UPI002ED22561
MTTNRLQSELQRLFAGGEAPRDDTGSTTPHAAAMQVGLSGAGAWPALSRMWQGVQADLDLPAPGIAVSGEEGYQLWFALAQPVGAQDAEAFLAALCRRYLDNVPAQRIARSVVVAGGDSATRVPPAEIAPGRWSAFVAPDLAGLFAEEPWVDLRPPDDAQADLLSRLQPITPAAWKAACDRLLPGDALVPQGRGEAFLPPQGRALAVTPSSPPAAQQDPRRFLLEVMNDPAVDLRLRIEAAKALLPYAER